MERHLGALLDGVHARFEFAGQVVELAKFGVDAAEVIFDFIEAVIYPVETRIHLRAQLLSVVPAEENASEDGYERDSDNDDIMHGILLLLDLILRRCSWVRRVEMSVLLSLVGSEHPAKPLCVIRDEQCC
jgi:hypothetical protein